MDTPINRNVDNYTKADKNAKVILSDKMLVSHILKYTISDLRYIPVERIAKKHIMDASKSEYQNERNKLIQSLNKDYFRIIYDTPFQVLLPNGKYMYVNIELQSYKPGYSLKTRALIYKSTLIVFQRLYGMSETYNDVCPCISIWICLGEPLNKRNNIHDTNHINEYHCENEDAPVEKTTGLFGITFILLGNANQKGINPLLRLLYVVFNMGYTIDKINSICL